MVLNKLMKIENAELKIRKIMNYEE